MLVTATRDTFKKAPEFETDVKKRVKTDYFEKNSFKIGFVDFKMIDNYIEKKDKSSYADDLREL